MNRMQILQRINELSDQTCRPCSTRIAAVSTNMKEKNSGTVNDSEVCKGCSVYTEFRSLGDQLLELSQEKRKQKKRNESEEKKVKEIKKQKPRTVLKMTVDEFVQLIDVQGKSILEIADMKSVSDKTVHAWKKRNQEAIQQARERIGKQNKGKSLQEKEEILKQPLLRSSQYEGEDIQTVINKSAATKLRTSEIDMNVVTTSDLENENLRQENADLKEKLKKIERMLHESSAKELEQQEEIEKLKREVLDAHKLVTEKEEELTRHDQHMDTFNDLMASKEQLHKENIRLENEVYDLRGKLRSMESQVNEKKKEASRYFSETIGLREQLKGLKIFVAETIKQDVYGS